MCRLQCTCTCAPQSTHSLTVPEWCHRRNSCNESEPWGCTAGDIETHMFHIWDKWSSPQLCISIYARDYWIVQLSLHTSTCTCLYAHYYLHTYCTHHKQSWLEHTSTRCTCTCTTSCKNILYSFRSSLCTDQAYMYTLCTWRAHLNPWKTSFLQTSQNAKVMNVLRTCQTQLACGKANLGM